jgi:hypothetical protein
MVLVTVQQQLSMVRQQQQRQRPQVPQGPWEGPRLERLVWAAEGARGGAPAVVE